MKQNELMRLSAKNYFTEKLYQDNNNSIQRKLTDDKILFPFFLIKLDNDSCYTIKQDEHYNKVCIFADKQFDIMYQDDILKEILKLE